MKLARDFECSLPCRFNFGGNLFENVCDGGNSVGKPVSWELAVENGVYEVTTAHNAFGNNFVISDFLIEGQKIKYQYRDRPATNLADDDPLKSYVEVEFPHSAFIGSFHLPATNNCPYLGHGWTVNCAVPRSSPLFRSHQLHLGQENRGRRQPHAGVASWLGRQGGLVADGAGRGRAGGNRPDFPSALGGLGRRWTGLALGTYVRPHASSRHLLLTAHAACQAPFCLFAAGSTVCCWQCCCFSLLRVCPGNFVWLCLVGFTDSLPTRGE